VRNDGDRPSFKPEYAPNHRVGFHLELDRQRRVSPRYAHTLLQEVVQAISGQGAPRPDLAPWAEIYRDAGVELVHAYDGDHGGIGKFVHVVRL
jgi:hypothetical protein